MQDQRTIVQHALSILIGFLATSLLVTLLAISLSLLWAVSHPKAPQTLYNWISQSAALSEYWPSGLAIEEISGPLYKGVTLKSVTFKSSASPTSSSQLALVKLESMTMQWQALKLLRGQLAIDQLEINKPEIHLKETTHTGHEKANVDWDSLNEQRFAVIDWHQVFDPLDKLPKDIKVNELQLKDIKVQQGELNWTIELIRFGFHWHQDLLDLKALTLSDNGSQITFTGQMQRHNALHTRIQFDATITDWQHFERLNFDKFPYSTKIPHTPAFIEGSLELNHHDIMAKIDLTGPVQLFWQQAFSGNDQLANWQTKLTLSSIANDHWLPLNLNTLELTSQGEGSLFGQDLRAHQTINIHRTNAPNIEMTNRTELCPNTNGETELTAILAANILDRGEWFGALTANLHQQTGQVHLQTEQFNLTDPDENNTPLYLNLSSHVQLLDWQERSLIFSINNLQLDGLEKPLHFNGHAVNSLINGTDYQLDWIASELTYGDHTGQLDLALNLSKDLSHIALNRLQLNLGDNRIHIQANLTDRFNALVNIDIPKLNQLNSQLNGQLTGKIRFEESAINPDWFSLISQASVNQAWQLNQIHWQNYVLDQAHLTMTGQLSDLLTHSIDLELSHLSQKNNALKLLEQLKFERRPTQKALVSHNRLNLTHPKGRLEMTLTDDWPESLGVRNLMNLKEWQVAGFQPSWQIDQLTLAADAINRWQLEQPSEGHWQGLEQGLSLSPLCIIQAPQARLCLRSAGQVLSWQAQQLPWQDWVKPFQPDSLTLLGEFDLKGQLNWQAKTPSKDFHWALNQTIDWPYLFLNWQTPKSGLPLTLLNWRQVLEASPNKATFSSQAQINSRGQLATQLQLAKEPSQSWSDALIKGQLAIDINDVYLANDAKNLVVLNDQSLSVKSEIKGKVSAPSVSSQLALLADFDLPLLGLAKQRLTLTGDLNYPFTDKIDLSGRWQQNNQDELNINMTVENVTKQSNQAPLFIRLDSENFQLLNTTMGQINSQLALQINYHPQAIQLMGDIRLQNTQIKLAREANHSRTQISDDEIILNKQGQAVEVSQNTLPLFIDLDIKFGDQVQIKGLDASVTLGGGLKLSKTPDQNDLKGFGQVDIKTGHVNLDRRNRIEIGQSRFDFNGPLNNPRLDVNLFRVVDQTTARLNITGQATRPQFVFYATPFQSRARIVNLLIFGRAGELQNEPNYESQMLTALYKLGLQKNMPILNDLTTSLGIEDIYFDVQDREVSNLIFGRAINNQLYINYAYNLSGLGQNAVQLFFNLTPNWFIKSESGENTNAIDLFYRIER